MLWQILFELCHLQADPETAQELQRQAREIVEYIADSIIDAELRALYLASAQVRLLFEFAGDES